jgi:subfamily B ATP-binding cassette protein HlyB/CyaB
MSNLKPEAESVAAARPADGGSPDNGQGGFKALVAIARHHQLDLSLARLLQIYGKEQEPEPADIVRIAQNEGLKAASRNSDWGGLLRLQKAAPFLVRVTGGGWFIVAKNPGGQSDEEQVFLFNPLVPGAKVFAIPRAEFTSHWTGEIVLLKRSYRLGDSNRPFSLAWFVPEFWRQWPLLRSVAAAALAMHLLALAVPIFFQIVIDRVLIYLSISTLVVMSIGVVLAICFDAVFGWLRGYFVLRVAARIDIRLARLSFQHLMSLPISYFDTALAGVVTKHMQQGTRIREFLTGRLLSTLLDLPALVIFLPLMIWYSAWLTLIVLVVTALLAATIAVMLGPYRRRLRRLYQAEAERQSLLVESVHGMRTVKSLNLEPRRQEAWEIAAAESVRTYVQVGKINLAASTLSTFMEKSLTIAIVVVGAFLVFAGHLTVGGMVAFNMLSSRMISPVLQVIGLLNSYQETVMSVEMLGEIMNRPGEVAGRGLTPALSGEIELDRVTFRYPGSESPALREVSLRIPAGSMVGIVGRSGSGKTTLAGLLQGLHYPSEGAVRFDGHNVRDIDLSFLRSQTGVVPQEPFLFRGTVKDNIRMGKPTASFEDVVEAARQAGADEFIQELAQRYDTNLEEGAVNLSGGQKQRISIARALLREPRIIIFDEATSALDPESEAIVVKNLRQIAKGRTTIVISHRLQTIRDTDAVIVLDAGKINDVGNHNQLMERNLIYRLLWSQQNQRSV